jgi:hypothetical protein
MQFKTSDSTPFEIPTNWWSVSGMSGFVSGAQHYRTTPDAPCEVKVVLVSEVAPLWRKPGLVGFSKSGFVEDRMVSILRAFCEDAPLPPIKVTETSTGLYRYKIYNGVHRYYASVAAGFSHLPVIVQPDIQEFLDRESGTGGAGKGWYWKLERNA